MLWSTLDMIGLVASDSLLIFFVFNLIVLAVVFGSKPCSGIDQETENPPCAATNSYTYTNTGSKQNVRTWCSTDGSFLSSMDAFKGSATKGTTTYDSCDYIGDLGAPSDSDSSSDDFSSDGSGAPSDSDSSSDDGGEEDDELRRRVEEFIARVNRGWKAELMRTSQMVYT